MPISNKDGSAFRLRGPNPLLRDQEEGWEGVAVHNLQPEEVVGSDPSRSERHISSGYDVIDVGQPAADELVADKLVAWCLLASVEERRDPLYGEVSHSIAYAEKFSFETVVLRRGDLDCELWSPVGKVTRDSIIYLAREWWRVTEVRAAEGGFVLTCFPSELHPSF